MRDIPAEADGYFLSLHARSLPDFEKKVDRLRGSDAVILITDGLAATLDKAFLDKPNVLLITSSVPAPCVFDLRGAPDPYDMLLKLGPAPADVAWDALASDNGWDVSMRYNCDPQMVARVLGMPHNLPEPMRRELERAGVGHKPKFLPIEDLRNAILARFGFSLYGPTLVGVQPLGDDYLVLHNFDHHEAVMRFTSQAKRISAPVLTLPASSQVRVTDVEDGTEIRIDPHTLVCCRLSPRSTEASKAP
jgi:hypothetical protein